MLTVPREYEVSQVEEHELHCNMVLENAKEMWTEAPRLANGQQGRKVNKDRFISKLCVQTTLFYDRCNLLTLPRFLRGDSVILVLLS
jgi:small nuclear ribonucleoprotein D2